MSEVKNTIGQAQRFLLVSGVSFCIDASAYWLLASYTDLGSSWAKRISFACITIWAFFAHKHYTFRNRRLSLGQPARFAMLYLTGWALNSLVHDVYATPQGDASTTAFLVATFVWACWNFLGQKYFVFRKGLQQNREEQV